MPFSLFCGLFVVGSKAGGRNSCKSSGEEFLNWRRQCFRQNPNGVAFALLKRTRIFQAQTPPFSPFTGPQMPKSMNFCDAHSSKARQIPEDNLSTTRPSHPVTEVRTDILDYFWAFSNALKTLNGSIFTHLSSRSDLYCVTDVRLLAVDEYRWISRLSLVH